MEIKKFRLTNVGQFKELELKLAPTNKLQSNVTVFVGNNGAGKTSILRALATTLSWFVSRTRSPKSSGNPLPEQVISTNAAFAEVAVEIFDDEHCSKSEHADETECLYQWVLTKTAKQRKSKQSSMLADATRLAEKYRDALESNQKSSLPLIALYPVERVVLDIPLKIKQKHSFNQIDGYDNSLNQGVDFRRFFEWFREREDTENEAGIPQDVFEELMKKVGENNEVWQQLKKFMASSRDRQLTAVRTAIKSFMPGFDNLRVRRRPRLHMSIDKNGERFDVLQLSQGEKSLMALVGDIARRMAMMNPDLQNPLNGDGIVLIDEVDMHLHPSWQRKIIKQLTTTFPNCQFILTTHSPLVISDPKDILTYSLSDGEAHKLESQYGQDANSVLLDVMDTQIRNIDIEEQLNDLLDSIYNNELNQAKKLLSSLELQLPNDHMELNKARILLRKKELKSAQNREN